MEICGNGEKDAEATENCGNYGEGEEIAKLQIMQGKKCTFFWNEQIVRIPENEGDAEIVDITEIAGPKKSAEMAKISEIAKLSEIAKKNCGCPQPQPRDAPGAFSVRRQRSGTGRSWRRRW